MLGSSNSADPERRLPTDERRPGQHLAAGSRHGNQFCLATRAPNGAPSDGILRVPTTVNGFGTSDNVKFTSAGGSDAGRRMIVNFWVCNLGGGLLGYAQFPGGNPATDGIVCGYQFTGLNGPGAGAYNLGRTATHEVGHSNLRHIWGDGGCGADDFVADTPESDGANYGCALGHVNCNTRAWSELRGLFRRRLRNVFSQGQADRVQALRPRRRPGRHPLFGWMPAGRRIRSGCSIECGELASGLHLRHRVDASVVLFNNGGNTLTSATITYSVDNGADMTYSWSGSLEFGESESVSLGTLTPGDGDHTFAATVSAPNGGIDEDTSNDAASSDFSLDSQGVDVELTLTLDNYPGETSWFLADADGNVVWSGGPYGASGTVVESTCVGDGCYTLTINDSFGDGMCCAYGNGGYEFSQDGVVLASGGDFGDTESTEVCVGDIVLGCTDSGACNYNPDAVATTATATSATSVPIPDSATTTGCHGGRRQLCRHRPVRRLRRRWHELRGLHRFHRVQLQPGRHHRRCVLHLPPGGRHL